MAGSRPRSLAAAATRRLARTASDMPRYPTAAEKPAPTRKNTERKIRTVMSSAGSASSAKNATAAKIAEGAELPLQVGVCALLHGEGDVLHVVGALAGGEDLGPEHRSHTERAERDQCDDDDQDEVATGEFDDSGIDPGHAVSSMRIRCELDWPRRPSPTERMTRARNVRESTHGAPDRCIGCDPSHGGAGIGLSRAPAGAQRAARAPSAESWMTNTLARPVIRKIFSSRSWVQISCERAVVGADLLQAADQDAETGGVEELDGLHVDDDVVDPVGDQLGDLVAQLGSRCRRRSRRRRR